MGVEGQCGGEATVRTGSQVAARFSSPSARRACLLSGTTERVNPTIHAGSVRLIVILIPLRVT